MHFPARTRHEIMPGELGYAWIPMAMAAAQAYAQSNNGGGEGASNGSGASQTEQNPGMPGANASAPRQPSAVTTVSPTIQTAINPQISPVMTQLQDSAGATVGANPTQYMPGGMKGEGGGAGVSPYGNYAAPGIPSGMPGQPYGSGFSPLSPYSLDPYAMRYEAVPYPTAQYTQPGGVGTAMAGLPWTALAIVGVAAVGGVYLLGKKRRVR